MAKERCSSCGGSGWFDQQHNKRCQRCYGTGRVEVPDPPSYGGGGGKKTCFVGSTPILTPDGWRPISELRQGDPVVSYDETAGTSSVRQVKRLREHKPVNIWEVHLVEHEGPISTTRSHTFLTNRGWRRTSQLRPGDVMTTVAGHEAVVASVVETGRVAPVFNLLTEVEHTFVAHGCVAHNFTYFRRVRVWWHRHILSGRSAVPQRRTEVFG